VVVDAGDEVVLDLSSELRGATPESPAVVHLELERGLAAVLVGVDQRLPEGIHLLWYDGHGAGPAATTKKGASGPWPKTSQPVPSACEWSSSSRAPRAPRQAR
jgi:hypothetical protein